MPIETTCRLAAAVGRQERCPEALCAYWEPAEGPWDGKRLRAPRDRAVPGDAPELAGYLLELRARIEDVRAH